MAIEDLTEPNSSKIFAFGTCSDQRLMAIEDLTGRSLKAFNR
ncbi:hypothetical protein [Cyanobacterium aponinum]